MSHAPQEITKLLEDWGKGDRQALEKLTPLVYSELRRIAQNQMKAERAGHTLQATALVNEAYMKLAGRSDFAWHDRSHFFAVCAQVMRHILIDHARAHLRDKRGGGAVQVSLGDVGGVSEQSERMMALDEGLRALEVVDAQKARIVELRYFAGLTIEDTADVLNISPTTVRREWRRARAWLYRFILEASTDET
jgi:RNA polymerase sigma factor (TIGR02999 family)